MRSEKEVLEEYYEVRKEEARYWLEKTEPPKDEPEEIDQEDFEDWIDFKSEGGHDPRISMYVEEAGYFLNENDAVRCVLEDIIPFTFEYGAVVQKPMNEQFPLSKKVRLFGWDEQAKKRGEISRHKSRITETIYRRLGG